jgi:hypothetical protein
MPQVVEGGRRIKPSLRRLALGDVPRDVAIVVARSVRGRTPILLRQPRGCPPAGRSTCDPRALEATTPTWTVVSMRYPGERRQVRSSERKRPQPSSSPGRCQEQMTCNCANCVNYDGTSLAGHIPKGLPMPEDVETRPAEGAHRLARSILAIAVPTRPRATTSPTRSLPLVRSPKVGKPDAVNPFGRHFDEG